MFPRIKKRKPAGPEACRVWIVVGIALALVLAATAWWRGRLGSGYYDGEVYGMTSAAHKRYAIAGAALACACAVSLVWEWLAIPVLTILTITAILYASSFLRGASDEA